MTLNQTVHVQNDLIDRQRAVIKALVEALEDAKKRLRGAGMLGGTDDPIIPALRAAKELGDV